MKASATEIKNHFGKYLDEARGTQSVVIEKMGRPVAVLISHEEYKRLTILDDAYWGFRATEAEKEGFLGVKESMKFLKSKLRK